MLRTGTEPAKFTTDEQAFLAEHVADSQLLQPRLNGSFQRLTLVDFERKERVTIDRTLTCGLHGESEHPFAGGLAIIEIKQPRPDRYAPAQQWLRSKEGRRASLAARPA